jgi:hypothetical protein
LSAQFAQDIAGLREQFTEDIAKALREQAKSGDGAAYMAKLNFPAAPSALWTQFTFASDPPEREEMRAGGIISHLTMKGDGNVHEKAPLGLLDLSSMRSMRSVRDAAAFFRSVAKDPDTTKQKVPVI